MKYLKPAPSMTGRWPRTGSARRPAIRCRNAGWLRCSDAHPAAGRERESLTHDKHHRSKNRRVPGHGSTGGAGERTRSHDLAGKVLTLTSDPDLRIAARLVTAVVRPARRRTRNAHRRRRRGVPRSPALAWDATGLAATVAYQAGLPEACAKARAALDAPDAPGGPVPAAKDRPAGLMGTGSGSRISSPCSSGAAAVRPAAPDGPPGPASRG